MLSSKPRPFVQSSFVMQAQNKKIKKYQYEKNFGYFSFFIYIYFTIYIFSFCSFGGIVFPSIFFIIAVFSY